MSFLKKWFGKKKSTAKHQSPADVNKEMAPSKHLDNNSADNEATTPKPEDQPLSNDHIIVQNSKNNALDTEQWIKKNQEIKDEDLVNQSLDIIFPRLKRGLIGNPKPQKMILPTKNGDQEVTLPAEMMMAGFDSGPDFSTCLAIDHDAMFTMLYNKHITQSGKSKEEVLQIAANNFLKRYGQNIQISKTIFEGVYELKSDGNSEASAFLFPNIWTNILQQLKLKTIYMVIPAQNTVLFWEEISDTTLADLIAKVTSVVQSYPKGSLVSNYKYQFENNGFTHQEKVFDLEL